MGKAGKAAYWTCILIVLLAVTLCIPMSMLCVGAVNVDNCSMQSQVPVFLIVAGILGVVLVCTVISLYICNQQARPWVIKMFILLLVIMILVNLGWSIAGSVWVFKEWKGWKDIPDNAAKPCHESMYLFSFAVLIIFWLLLPFLLVGIVLGIKKTDED